MKKIEEVNITMNKRQYISIIISLIILFAIRIIGIKTISHQILVAITTICLIIIVVGIFKRKKYRRKLPIAIVCVLVGLVTELSVFIIGNFNNKYQSLLLISSGILYLVLMALVVMEIKYKHSKNR